MTLIEIDIRNIRIAFYLMGKQVLNFPTYRIEKKYYDIFYTLNLWKLRILSKFRKVRIGFWVTEPSKWTNQELYNELKNDKHFEPFILASYFNKVQGEESPKEYYNKTKEFFINNGAVVYDTFDADNFTFKGLDAFKPDIIFYQQPWMIDENQKPKKVHKKSLICYIPYCFYSMDSHLNYLAKFHAIMWKYFVETDLHKKEYEKMYGAHNCVTSGSTKLDGYHFVNRENAETCWKSKDKIRIIYAPHHSFNDGLHEIATFKENGRFILELAKSRPETEWIFRPHPLFIDRIVKSSIMTLEEVNNYYNEWAKIGSVSKGGNYYEMFCSSDILITDCISFLSEYAPTAKPVLHLRKNYQKESFNTLVSKLDEGYYQIYTIDELKNTFDQVVIQGRDTLKPIREKNKNLLPTDTLAGRNIYEYLKHELWLDK